jgi:hypothetical protein
MPHENSTPVAPAEATFHNTKVAFIFLQEVRQFRWINVFDHPILDHLMQRHIIARAQHDCTQMIIAHPHALQNQIQEALLSLDIRLTPQLKSF